MPSRTPTRIRTPHQPRSLAYSRCVVLVANHYLGQGSRRASGESRGASVGGSAGCPCGCPGAGPRSRSDRVLAAVLAAVPAGRPPTALRAPALPLWPPLAAGTFDGERPRSPCAAYRRAVARRGGARQARIAGVPPPTPIRDPSAAMRRGPARRDRSCGFRPRRSRGVQARRVAPPPSGPGGPDLDPRAAGRRRSPPVGEGRTAWWLTESWRGRRCGWLALGGPWDGGITVGTWS